MPTVFAPSPWPAPLSPNSRLGREVSLGHVPGAPKAWQWLLQRQCSISPRQLLLVYLSMCAVSVLIGLFFLVQGAPWVLGFAGLELVVVGAALLIFARHAADRETLTLVGGSLHVEQWLGARVQRAEFASDWVTVEPSAGQGSLVKLSSRGRTFFVGRFLRPHLRAALAAELRQALRRPWPVTAPPI